MNKTAIFDQCVSTIEKLLSERKLKIVAPISARPQHWFAEGRQIFSGITVSTVEGEAGIITRVWGIVFVDPTNVKCCTNIHTSYYGESFALQKLLKELQSY
jgi:hypothetical protein